MSDRFDFENGFDNDNKSNSFYSDKSRNRNDFKVSIDGLDNQPPEYVPQKTFPSSPYIPISSAGEKSKFEVKIPTSDPFEKIPSSSDSSKDSNSQRQKATVRNQPSQKRLVKRTSPQASRSRDLAVKKPSDKKQKASGKPRSPKLTPEQIAKRNAKRKYKMIKGLLITCMCLIFIAAVTATLSTLALSTINDILALDSDASYTVSVVIPANATYEQVFDILCDNGLVSQKTICNIFCKFRKYDTVDYEAGVYYLESDSGIENMLETIMVHKSVSKDTVRLTFPEGWTVAQIFAKIEKYDVCEAEKLYANLDIIGDQYDFYKDLPATPGRYLKAEGYLFPDTYDFYLGESASSVLKKLFSNFQTKWTSEFTDSLNESGFTKDQIIIIASIIQREANDSTQMADISSVIHNRLADSATFPQLQMNSTQDYIKSLKDYNILSDFYYSTYLQSYNTFSVEGLPPGAICNPSIDAIEAALNPSDTNYKFFCHDSSGNIYLAETADEHAANTAKALS